MVGLYWYIMIVCGKGELSHLNILGISGSLRKASFNRGLLRAAQELAPDDVEIELFDLLDIPIYNGDVEADGKPDSVQRLQERIVAADAVLIATPEYNGSYSGVLKNAIDWASRPFPQPVLAEKPVGIMGAAAGRFGTARAQQVLSHATVRGPEQAEAQAVELDLGLVAEAPSGPYRRRLPDERPAITHKFRVGEQEGYITVGLFDDGKPGELFITISKEGSTIRGLMDSVAVLTSLALQYGVPLEDLSKKFRGVHFEPAGLTNNKELPNASSLIDYIFRWLVLRFGKPSPSVTANALASGALEDVSTGLACPDCGSVVVFAEGCLTCRSCGYTKCG